MAALKPKDFIRQVFIDELGVIAGQYHYISFALIATGIEFLGKCLDTSTNDWNASGRSRLNFKAAINALNAFEDYRHIDELLYSSLRCGFAHSFVPKYGLTLSSRNEMGNLVIHGRDRVNLRCEDLYEDFRRACEEIISMEFELTNKMNLPLLAVPSP